MRRTKGWWAQLTAEERSTLVYLEQADKLHGNSFNLPPGYHGCTGCGNPTSGWGICIDCDNRRDALIAKANDAWYPAAEMVGTIGGYYDV